MPALFARHCGNAMPHEAHDYVKVWPVTVQNGETEQVFSCPGTELKVIGAEDIPMRNLPKVPLAPGWTGDIVSPYSETEETVTEAQEPIESVRANAYLEGYNKGYRDALFSR